MSKTSSAEAFGSVALISAAAAEAKGAANEVPLTVVYRPPRVVVYICTPGAAKSTSSPKLVKFAA